MLHRQSLCFMPCNTPSLTSNVFYLTSKNAMTEIISEGINYTLYLSVPLALIGGLLYHFLPYSQQSRWCFSGLMFLFSLALTRVILIRSGWMEARPTTFFLPIWYTLSFGVLIFYAVKMRLLLVYNR